LGKVPTLDTEIKAKQFGILLQGPLVREREYTLQFARYYKSIYPKSEVVVSTWDYYHAHKLKSKFERSGIHLLLNQLPTNSGRANVYLQIVSTLNGLKYLQKLGVTSAIKTRTDQVLANPLFLEVFLRKVHDVEEGGKIVVTTFNSFGPPSISISDMVQFGRLDALIHFWSLPDKEDWSRKIYADTPEVYLVNRYIAMKRSVKAADLGKYALSDLKEFFSMVDSNEVDQVWVKKSTLDIKGYWRVVRRKKLDSESFNGFSD